MKQQSRIFVYTGSCNPSSTTELLARTLVERYQEKSGQEVLVDYYNGRQTKLAECMGCTKCFLRGSCVLDSTDDMKEVRNHLLLADLVIFGSPVYFHNVTGSMKKFLDRISYWTHTMELTGKPGITIATSGGNGLSYVSDYLAKFFDYLGVIKIASLEAATYSKEFMEQTNLLPQMEKEISGCVQSMMDYLVDGKKLTPGSRQCRIFDALNQKYKHQEAFQDMVAEVKRWYEQDFPACQSYEEAMKKRSQSERMTDQILQE